MRAAKKIADLLTLARALIALLLAALGVARGVAALPLAAGLLAAAWTSDALDGACARLSRVKLRSWIGDHDLQIDMSVALGLLLYLAAAGFLAPWAAALYGCAWALVFWRVGAPPALGMLFQAPVYGLFLLVLLADAPVAGLALLAWIALAVVLTWPRFPQETIPGFLAGMRRLPDGKQGQTGGRSAG